MVPRIIRGPHGLVVLESRGDRHGRFISRFCCYLSSELVVVGPHEKCLKYSNLARAIEIIALARLEFAEMPSYGT